MTTDYKKREEHRQRMELLQTLPPEARVYTLDEACLILAATHGTVLKMIEAGALRAMKNPQARNGHYLISAAAIAACIRKMEGGVKRVCKMHRMPRVLERFHHQRPEQTIHLPAL